MPPVLLLTVDLSGPHNKHRGSKGPQFQPTNGCHKQVIAPCWYGLANGLSDVRICGDFTHMNTLEATTQPGPGHHDRVPMDKIG